MVTTVKCAAILMMTNTTTTNTKIQIHNDTRLPIFKKAAYVFSDSICAFSLKTEYATIKIT